MTPGTRFLTVFLAIAALTHMEPLFTVHAWPWWLFVGARMCLLGVGCVSLWQVMSNHKETPA